MPEFPVQFRYLTGVKDKLFSNARLVGSWDSQGRYSDRWSSQEMQETTTEDGCPAFVATVALDNGEAGQTFHWGVRLDGPAGTNLWGIMTEVNESASRERYRTFFLPQMEIVPARGGTSPDRPEPARVETYRLSEARYLGAQKFYGPRERPAIQFRTWAPNATNVEVVMGTTWLANDPAKTPQDRPLPKGQICGGYVADDGTGSHPDWGPFAMTRDQDGTWATSSEDGQLADFSRFDHRPYMYRVTKDDGSQTYKTDIYSRCQIGWGKEKPAGHWEGGTLELDGSVSCSVIIDPDLVTKHFSEDDWPEQNWLDEADFWADEFTEGKPVPNELQELVIYELHVGALGFGKTDDQPGTLQDAIDLLPYLEDLGVNAIELLPISEFGGGGGGWGYSTSHYLAIEYGGGGRDNFKWFIKECHRRGIAVIMDVVYNHYNHDAGRAQWMFDTNSHEKNVYYWYQGKPDDYPRFNAAVEESRRGMGGYVDNISTGFAPRYHEETLRQMFISSAVMLTTEFHVDGFRMDQTTSIHAYNALHADGSPVPSANSFGLKLLRELTRTLRFVKPDVMLMAEDHSNWDAVTQTPDQGGLGFDKVWYADFYHHLIGDTDKGSDYAKLIKTAGLGDDRSLAMGYFAGALDDSGSHKVVYNESHDEAGNGQFTHRTIAVAANQAPLLGDTRRYAEARCRFAAAITLLSAGTPMFLFGEEVGAEKDFLYGSVLKNREDLQGMRHDSGARLFAFYRDLIRLRRDNPGFRSRQIEVLHSHDDNRVLALRRWGDGQEFLVVGSLNNRPFDQPNYRIESGALPAGRWREIFNSDAAVYGGDNVGNAGGEITSGGGSTACVVPANGVVVLQRVG